MTVRRFYGHNMEPKGIEITAAAQNWISNCFSPIGCEILPTRHHLYAQNNSWNAPCS